MDWPAHLHGPAGWVHDKRLSLALTADKIVPEMVAYPEPAKATSNPPVAGRLAQALLQEVAAHIFREDAPPSPSRRRRT